MSKLVRWEESISSGLMIILALLTVLQVVVRYFFQLPFPWVEELARYSMIAMIYIGSAVAVHKKEHLNVELLDMILKEPKKRVVGITHQFLILVFVIFLVYVSTEFILFQIKIGQVSPAMQISMAWPIGAILLGGILMLIHGIYSVYISITVKHSDTIGDEGNE
jgi:TRAP-type transport system small permease protein